MSVKIGELDQQTDSLTLPWRNQNFSCMAQHSELFLPEEPSQSEPPGRYLGADTSQKTLPAHTRHSILNDNKQDFQAIQNKNGSKIPYASMPRGIYFKTVYLNTQ